MPRWHVEAQSMTRAAPEVVCELAGGASSYCGWGRAARAATRARALRRWPARTHAGERSANAAALTVSCAPSLSGPRGSDDYHVSSRADMPCLELVTAWPAEVTAPGQLRCGGAPEPVSWRC
jgi:hypothetical protein